MKIEFLEKIVGKIQHEIHCPKCKNVFAKGSLDICSVNNKRLEFSSYCHICGISSQIVADINVQDYGDNEQVPLSSTPYRHLNPENVKKITEELSCFDGEDIQKLFQ